MCHSALVNKVMLKWYRMRDLTSNSCRSLNDDVACGQWISEVLAFKDDRSILIGRVFVKIWTICTKINRYSMPKRRIQSVENFLFKYVFHVSCSKRHLTGDLFSYVTSWFNMSKKYPIGRPEMLKFSNKLT